MAERSDGGMTPMRMFVEDQRGGIAVTLALLAPVLIVAGGSAIDLGTQLTARSELRNISELVCVRLATSIAAGDVSPPASGWPRTSATSS